MYKLNTFNGDLHCPDGTILSVPYSDPHYSEYATWLDSGNQPEEINVVPPPAVPEEVSRFQALAALDAVGYYDAIVQALGNPAVPRKNRLAFENAQVFRRDSELVAIMAAGLGLSTTDLDNLFILASQITA